MLAEPNLKKIEEVPAKEVPSNRRGREPNFHVETAKVGVLQPNAMQRGFQDCPSGHLIVQLRSLKDVKAKRVSDPATQEGALRSRI